MKPIKLDGPILLRILAFLCLLAPLAACDSDLTTSPTAPPPESSPSPPSTPTLSDQPSILVDATRDGGVWWCCKPNNHQGKKLAEYLRSLGFEVEELRSGKITRELLTGRSIVIRANEYTGYSGMEVQAYHDYVSGGGKLLLLSDYQRPRERDSLAESFGIVFYGMSQGENVLDRFEPHPITQGITRPIYYGVGSGIAEAPVDAQVLGHLSKATFLDLNGNKKQESNEPTGAAALGRMAFGRGEIVFCGDTNMWQSVPQPLVDDTIDWLDGPS